jgi:hypothetical protein
VGALTGLVGSSARLASDDAWRRKKASGVAKIGRGDRKISACRIERRIPLGAPAAYLPAMLVSRLPRAGPEYGARKLDAATLGPPEPGSVSWARIPTDSWTCRTRLGQGWLKRSGSRQAERRTDVGPARWRRGCGVTDRTQRPQKSWRSFESRSQSSFDCAAGERVTDRVRDGLAASARGSSARGRSKGLGFAKKIAKRTQSHRRNPSESEVSAVGANPTDWWSKGVRSDAGTAAGAEFDLAQGRHNPDKPANDAHRADLIGVSMPAISDVIGRES